MNTPRANIWDGLGGLGREKAVDYIAENHCGDRDNPSVIPVLSTFKEYELLLLEMKKRCVGNTCLTHFDAEVFLNDFGKKIEHDASLASRVIAEQLVNLYYKGRRGVDGKWDIPPKAIPAIISLYQNPLNRERYLSEVAKLPIDIFFIDYACVDAEGRIVDDLIQRGGSVGSLFHTKAEFLALPEMQEAVEGICFEDEITLIAALPGQHKTNTMLHVARSGLAMEPLFGHFRVPKAFEKVIYLTPEASARPFYNRLKRLGLDEFLDTKLFVRTLTKGLIKLDNPGLLEVVRGADIFLDTLTRFVEGNENDVADVSRLSENLFSLQAAGARTIWASHHSPKTSTGDTSMTLENMLRGSGDLGALTANCYALRLLNPQTNTVYVQCVKRRDAEPTLPFIVEGLDLRMSKKPGEAGPISDHIGNKAGRPETSDKEEKMQLILDLTKDGKTLKQISEQAGVSEATVKRWKKEAERDDGRPGW